MFRLVKITDREAWKIRGIVLLIIILGLLNVTFPVLNLLRDVFGFTGMYGNYESACIVLNVFGIPCTFCGLSRSFAALINLDFRTTVYFNPVSIVIYPLGFIIISLIIILSFFNYKIGIVHKKAFLYVVITMFILMWLINILYGHQQ
ncbi:MAG TPA: DUF2752 domain-containing protein [Ignavibacteria bacterium]|nr:DUF2752 domain-containing protein [Ignavibacteria bacterium]